MPYPSGGEDPGTVARDKSGQPSAITTFAQSPNSGGIQPTQQSNFGINLAQPGQAEQYWQANQGRWQQNPYTDWASSALPTLDKPSQGENIATGAAQAFSQPTELGKFWQGVQGQFNNKFSDLTPQFDAAYDRAGTLATSGVNNNLASRGAYGSSVGLGQVGQTLADIEAARAKESTNFQLQNQQNQQNWLGAFGNLAGATSNLDTSRLGAQGNLGLGIAGQGLSRLDTASGIAGNMNTSDIQRLQGGADHAFQEQSAERARSQDAINNYMNLLNSMTGFSGSTVGGAVDSDQQNFMDSINAMLGSTKEAENQSQNHINNLRGTANDVIGAYSAFKK